VAYRARPLEYVSLQTGSGPETTDFDGRVDALVITPTDGRSRTVDFEPDSA